MPFNDDVLRHAKFVDLSKVESCTIADVEFFVARFESHFSFGAVEMDELQSEFVDLQLLSKEDIPKQVWDEAKLEDGQGDVVHHRMDVIWSHLAETKCIEGKLRYPLLSRVARAVLILPHSNAEEERVFSLVTKNKTNFRPNLALDGTLASILTVKLACPESYTPCHKFTPTREMLDSAKHATWEYNKAHSSKDK